MVGRAEAGMMKLQTPWEGSCRIDTVAVEKGLQIGEQMDTPMKHCKRPHVLTLYDGACKAFGRG